MKAIAIAYIAAGLLIDFLPRHARPDFRYTGSDPANLDWNLGWPLALFIYDPTHGLQVGPFAYPMLAFQSVVFAVGLIVVLAVRRLRNQPMQRTGQQALS
jgi:hypothetical protein